MKNINDFGVYVPEILLPAGLDLETWAVIACDQYTQDRQYWKKVEEKTCGKVSALNLILPEVYLGDEDKKERIAEIRRTMKKYIENGVFAPSKKGFVYVERTTAFGRTRKGLVSLIDLETYEWKPFSKANIRATEATIVERIPPRMEIRKGAALEMPHIMLLVNDKACSLVEGCSKILKNEKNGAEKIPLYEGPLMNNGGSIKGWLLETEAELAHVSENINRIAEENAQADGSTFLFAVGDGNHSLATAKAVWDEYKAGLKANGANDSDLKKCPVRYALVEIVNLYDSGLTFEPIHRVLFDAEPDVLLDFLVKKMEGSVKEISTRAELENLVKTSHADFGFSFLKDGKEKYVLLHTEISGLAVAGLQPVLDEFINTQNGSGKKIEIDYIHGTEEILDLGKKADSVGILLPPIAKDSFFDTIGGGGPLPRKSFSMGEADEKRFYLECRKLFD